MVRIFLHNFLSSGFHGRLFGVMTWIHIVCLVAMSILGLDNMDLLCMSHSHVLYSILLFMDLQCTFGSHGMVIFMGLQCILGIHDIVIFMDLQCIGLHP